MRINQHAHEIFCSGFIFVAESLLSRVTGNWQASKASETVLGVDNWKFGVWIVRTPLKHTRGLFFFFSKKIPFLGLPPVFFLPQP